MTVPVIILFDEIILSLEGFGKIVKLLLNSDVLFNPVKIELEMLISSKANLGL